MTKPNIQILMVEDNETDALLLEEALSRDGLNSFAFTLSERLKTGLEILHQQKFDLILLDLGLPDSQGLESFEKVHNEFPDIPVVVLSGLMDEKLALEAVQAGARIISSKDLPVGRLRRAPFVMPSNASSRKLPCVRAKNSIVCCLRTPQ